MNFGLIGNCRSAALVSLKGEIEWACLPDYDSFSVFAKILDTEKGGSFLIEPEHVEKTEQYYLKNTNILVTKFLCSNSELEIYDFMPRYKTSRETYYCPPDIIRYVKVVKGTPEVMVNYDPQLCYAATETFSMCTDLYLKNYTKKGPYESVYLYSNIDLVLIQQKKKFSLNNDCYFWISYNQKINKPDLESAHFEMARTKDYWLDWSSRTKKFSKYNDVISRSALALKLLAYQKSGAILAAVTTSLPEKAGDVRNWDYRFCWVRDASMIIDTLTSLGHYNAAKRYLDFIINVIPYKHNKMQIMYGINGQTELTEKILDHLSGYKQSRPVRIGNSAFKQKQNDIYGVLLDVLYKSLNIFHSSDINSEDIWTIVRSLMRVVEKNWMLPDKGIWEYRSMKEHFVFSRVLCWVAADRAVKIADLLGMKTYVGQWTTLRETIKREILEKGWNSDLNAFTQFYGSQYLDAANLLMEQYGFLEADDPKYKMTVLKTYERLCHNGLMYRYRNEDDFGLPGTSFTICTFWMIDSLYKIGEHELAQQLFDQILKYSNHLGLYSEGIGFKDKELTGNFPQGYSHLALINTASLLSGQKITNEKLMVEV